MNIAPSDLAWRDAYKLMVGSILPRPIAFVSTLDEEGVSNLAPFSFFAPICASPMMICFAPMLRGTDGVKKDTLRNIEATKQFVVNIVSEKLAGQVNECATEYASDVDEFEAAGLTKVPSEKVHAFRVLESQIHMECELHEVLSFGDQAGAGHLVIGKVVYMHVNDEVYDNGKIDTVKLEPIGRMAGAEYSRASTDTFILERKK
ncbi:flavin reductase family protein [Paenibacillus sp. N1-5-1-14]|uniref:flavin reductase family protein n=1 Tax=Paenibacillus radicibacter TaxID=2972488 RepID=UPI002158F2F7|nr:flavin reductase family protein [Paenibacillus radicibacter]MCR8641246.1 flavin reductase family protein [Paenibacillus radicibacter]